MALFRQKWPLFLLALHLFFAPFLSAKTGSKCPVQSWSELLQIHKNRGEHTLVFFASWCASCVKHLQENQGPKVLLVAAFDEQKRAENVIDMLGIDAPCYTSLDIAEVFDVKALPSIKIVRF